MSKNLARNAHAPKVAPEQPAGAHVESHVVREPSAPPIPDFDRLIHERVRLGIVSALSVNQSLTFNDLKRLLQTTDGNISVHARKLEEAGYLACVKTFQNRMPKTEYSLTPAGRKAWDKYLNHMEALVQAMKGSA